MQESYYTIKANSEGLFKDRGSKFFAFAYPVKDETEIRKILVELRKNHHNARHHCYAWRLRPDASLWRVNDDGEPGNSAGKPIYNQIEKRNLTNILIVVVRYFGGTLLGVGGLINAYRTAAENALEESKIIKKFIRKDFTLDFEYDSMNSIMKLLKDANIEVKEQNFDLRCRLSGSVKLKKIESFSGQIALLEGCILKWSDAE